MKTARPPGWSVGPTVRTSRTPDNHSRTRPASVYRPNTTSGGALIITLTCRSPMSHPWMACLPLEFAWSRAPGTTHRLPIEQVHGKKAAARLRIRRATQSGNQSRHRVELTSRCARDDRHRERDRKGCEDQQVAGIHPGGQSGGPELTCG